MKIAVVHDYFIQQGGAEKVAEVIYNTLPGATLYATVALPEKMPETLRNVPVHTTWMQRLPGITKFYRFYFALYPFAVSSLKLSDADLVVSSSSGYVKGVRANTEAVHVCYCHTPMRWVWSFNSYSERESFGGIVKTTLMTLLSALRAWDLGAARQPDHFIANSEVVSKRIERSYGRYAEVIAPPIDVDRFKVSYEVGEYYIILARLVAYKRMDLAVTACSQLGRKLIVMGDGPDLAKLKELSGPSVTFMGRVTDDKVEQFVRFAKALIFPGEEDFGMAPLEVAAAGRPTIAFRAGGAIETIVEGVTGVFFDHQTPESLMDAICRFESQTWSPDAIRQHSEKFSTEVFQQRLLAFLTRVGSPVPTTDKANAENHQA